MIRLIASDMDGTLLDENGEVPPETFGLIHELAELGMRFCVSSGRSHELLRQNFAPVADEMDYICSNGAFVYAGGECLAMEYFSVDAISKLAKVVNLFDAHHLMFAGEGSWSCDDTPEKFERLHKIATEDISQFVRRLPAPGERVTTGWFLSERPEELEDLAYVLTLEMGDLFQFNYTSVGMDLSMRGINKATGIQKVMDYYGIRPDEVVAYGDSMNDYEILRLVGHPVVVGSAFYAPTQVSERVIETNAEHGVQRDMARIVADLRAGGDGLIGFGRRQQPGGEARLD